MQMSTVEVCRVIDSQGIDLANAKFATVILWICALPLAHG